MTATSRASNRPSNVDFDEETAASSRRGFLQTGAGAALGLTLPSMLLRAETAGARLAAGRGQPVGTPIRSCIFVYFYGGPSHIDTWDMKPSAPQRGPRRILADRDRRPGNPGLRAPAATRSRGAEVVHRPQHAPPDDEPQRGRGRSDVRTDSVAGRPRAARRRRAELSQLRRGAELFDARVADRSAARRAAARDVQRRAVAGSDGRISRPLLRAVSDHRRSQRRRNSTSRRSSCRPTSRPIASRPATN